MTLLDVLNEINAKSVSASQPTDMVIGTVAKTDPLEIKIDEYLSNLQASVLFLTESVIEKKITNPKHKHTIHDTYTGGGSCDNALEDFKCYENKKELPKDDDYIILNRGLEVNDKVLLLKVQHGQRFIVLTRLF